MSETPQEELGRLREVEFLHNGCQMLREKDNAYLLGEVARAQAETERMRVGVEALVARGLTGWDLTPTTTGQISQEWVYRYLAQIDAAWRARLTALLTEEQ